MLPLTKVTLGSIFFTNKEILKQAKRLIRNLLGYCCETSILKIAITPDEIPSLIYQLAVENVIQKFYPLDTEGTFICISRNVPIIIASIDGFLQIYLEECLTFDFDYGFLGRDDVSNLNSRFKRWKESGDITAPILRTNDISSLQSSTIFTRTNLCY